MFNRFSRLVKEAFQDDPRFLTARDKVSSTFTYLSANNVVSLLDAPVVRCSELIAVLFFQTSLQAYKAVVNDATIFKLELPMKQKG